MEHISFGDVDVAAFLRDAELATANHTAFAKFVWESEKHCANNVSGEVEDLQTQYRRIWMELEIVNALALDDWESKGKPQNWLPEWDRKYKNQALEIVAELRAILST
ncbi:hypothetical protein UNDKW_3952 [Undibacterium sp. KW1]|uniref:hypothetical protein n=1 Tax=Undibacterium sp. KW1 TaxID=2058624 RepID=UPI001331DC2A|nr:hypothetical protein [Undibacterium sp. KW1]BBB62225.1 hypothetical protein UNDKW_3952 [Undibacterium sp. KW1]